MKSYFIQVFGVDTKSQESATAIRRILASRVTSSILTRAIASGCDTALLIPAFEELFTNVCGGVNERYLRDFPVPPPAYPRWTSPSTKLWSVSATVLSSLTWDRKCWQECGASWQKTGRRRCCTIGLFNKKKLFQHSPLTRPRFTSKYLQSLHIAHWEERATDQVRKQVFECTNHTTGAPPHFPHIAPRFLNKHYFLLPPHVGNCFASKNWCILSENFTTTREGNWCSRSAIFVEETRPFWISRKATIYPWASMSLITH